MSDLCRNAQGYESGVPDAVWDGVPGLRRAGRAEYRASWHSGGGTVAFPGALCGDKAVNGRAAREEECA